MNYIKAVMACALVFGVYGCASASPEAPQATPSLFEAGQAYHYAGEVRIDPETRWLQARWTITADETPSAPLVFLLNGRLGNVSISGPDVVSFEAGPGEGRFSDFTQVSVTFSDGAAVPRSFELSYEGVLFEAPDPSAINSISPDKIELTLDSFWMPVDARFSERLTADVRFQVPGAWSVVSTEPVTVSDGVAQVRTTLPQLDIAVTFLKDPRSVETAGYQIYDTRMEPHDLEDLASAAGYCTGYLNARFGAREALPQASIVIHDRAESGYSRGTLIALTDVDDEISDQTLQFICHEFSHFWSSNGNPGGVENWLNEAFAEYVALMALREARGEAAYEETLAGYAAQIERAGALPPIWTPADQSRRPYLVNYRKGPLALASLEDLVGGDAFATFLRRYMVERVSTTPELLNVLEEVTDAETTQWFESELAR